MKYILVLSFLFKKYKKPLNLRIFSDSTLIDDLYLCDKISLKEVDRRKTSIKYRKFDELDFYYVSKQPPQRKSKVHYPEKILVYEINDSILGEEIRIEVDDHDTNYTNGFMTESNLFTIQNIFLFPKESFLSKNIKKIFKLWSKNKGALLENEQFPSEHYRKRLIMWPGESAVINNGIAERLHWYGGKKDLVVPVIKKFNTFMLWCGKSEQIKHPLHWWFNTEFLEYDEIYQMLNTFDENQ